MPFLFLSLSPTFLFIFAPYFPAVSLIAEKGSEQMALSLGVYIYLCVSTLWTTSSVSKLAFPRKQEKEEENQTNVPLINQFRADVSEKFLSPFRLFFFHVFFVDLNHSKNSRRFSFVCVCVFYVRFLQIDEPQLSLSGGD